MAYSHGGVGAGTGYLPSRSTLVPQPLQFSVERCFGFPQTQTLVGSICAELDLSRDTRTPDHPGCGAMVEAQQEISGFTTPVFLLAVLRLLRLLRCPLFTVQLLAAWDESKGGVRG